MNCSQCNNPMKEGYVFLTFVGSGGCGLTWTNDEPSSMKIKKMEGEKNILKFNILKPGKKNWLRKASYCEKCDLYLFKGEYEK